jgi:hypothetical protein
MVLLVTAFALEVKTGVENIVIPVNKNAILVDNDFLLHQRLLYPRHSFRQ